MKQRVSNDTYLIMDEEGDEVVLSWTQLHPMKSTTGHAHPHEEIYSFTAGHGTLELDHVPRGVFPGLSTVIAPNVHHRVFNTTEEELDFVCCWKR